MFFHNAKVELRATLLTALVAATFGFVAPATQAAPLNVTLLGTDSPVPSRTRATYDGPLVLGEDLMRFEIDKDVAVFNARKERVNIDAAIKR